MIATTILFLFCCIAVVFVSSLKPPPAAVKRIMSACDVLPTSLIVGYCNWNQCDDSIVARVEEGVNVIIWFSINLAVDVKTGEPAVTNGPDMKCVAGIVNRIRDLGLQCTHLISVGGWNSPHPDTSNSAQRVFDHFNRWNRETIANKEMGFLGFDGIDWDIEGNDDMSSAYNTFTPACLNLMGEFSQLAKQAGYVVAMAPAESYLDARTSDFSLSLLHDYPEWRSLQPSFTYHGRNVYAYLLARYGLLPGGERVFDFVTLQLYEGYSHALYDTAYQQPPVSPKEYLKRVVESYERGWQVDFSQEPALGMVSPVRVSVAAPQLVLGLANGWAGDGKFLFVDPSAAGEAWVEMEAASGRGAALRGFAYWNMLDEGRAPQSDPEHPVFMAKTLNRYLHVREEKEG